MTDPSKGSLVRRYLTFATGLVECLCFAGVLFGWASLVFVLKEDNYFSSLCFNVTSTNGTVELGQFSPAHQTWHQKYMALVFHKRCIFVVCVSTDCSIQDEQFSLVFTIASFMNNFMSLPIGFLFDFCGTTVARLSGMWVFYTPSISDVKVWESVFRSVCVCVFLDVCEVAVLCWFVIMKYTHLRNVKDTLSLWGQTV